MASKGIRGIKDQDLLELVLKINGDPTDTDELNWLKSKRMRDKIPVPILKDMEDGKSYFVKGDGSVTTDYIPVNKLPILDMDGIITLYAVDGGYKN